jgi:hypothetical protein
MTNESPGAPAGPPDPAGTYWRIATRALVGFVSVPALTLGYGKLVHKDFPAFLLDPKFLLLLAAASIASALVLRTMRSAVALLMAPLLTAVFVVVIGLFAG